MEKVIPIGNFIYVEPEEPALVTETGIQLLQAAKEELGRGIVYSIGRGVESELKEGDRVVFKKYLGRPTEVEGRKFLRFIDGDIEGIIEES